jgi:hypothetical protein
MSPEKKYLMEDLLDEQHAARRDATLLAGAEVLRRKRVRRIALRSLGTVAVLGLTALSIQRFLTPPMPQTATVASVPVAPAAVQPRGLTDEELLALFPNTPVALATLDNGKKRLIFPHPGDEQKFITRM